MVSEGIESPWTQFCQNWLLLLSLFSPLWSILTFFFVSTLFLFLLFASRPSILPLLMWQAWEMKSWCFMSGKVERLLFFFFFPSIFCLQTWTEKKKKSIIWEANTITPHVRLNKRLLLASKYQLYKHADPIWSVWFISFIIYLYLLSSDLWRATVKMDERGGWVSSSSLLIHNYTLISSL